MLDIKEVYKIQAETNIVGFNTVIGDVTFEEYINQCRLFIADNLPADYNKGEWDKDKKAKVYMDTITSFIDKHKIPVKGYVSGEGVLDLDTLMMDVVDTMTGLGILKEAFEDPEIDEIQINDFKTIFVVRKGVLESYADKKGRELEFVNDEEIRILVTKLIDDGLGNMPTWSEGKPLLNAKTAKEQYRVNAVNHNANARSKVPFDFPITSVVIRKFKEVKLTIDDLISSEAITPKMGRFLMKLGEAELKLFCVGPTGSGKTTLLNIIAQCIPMSKRIILVQNPTEITLFDRDQISGRNRRNVMHWEVTSSVDMVDLISNSLRATPDVIIVGESRTSDEFEQVIRSMQTGQRVLGTFHAENWLDALGRCGSELSAGGKMSRMEAVRLAAETIDIVIAQYRLPDGRRKVMEISEVIGMDEKNTPIGNVLFKFSYTGKVSVNSAGLKVVEGKHEMVGAISEKLANMFYKAGVGKDEIEEFMTIGEA
jgi:pilus assembly protein CpaF